MDELSRFFAILEIRPGASRDEIKQAYRDLAQIWHPDRYEHNPRLRSKAEAKLKDLNEAYQRLSNYTKPPQETAPPPKSPPPQNKPRHASEPPNTNKPESSKTTPSSNVGCIIIAIVVAVVIVITAQQGSEPKVKIQDPQPHLAQVTPNNTSELETLSQMKVQIEKRVAAKNVEFDRLEQWYKTGVTAQEELTYRNALEAAQKEESEIASLILAYNSKKKEQTVKASEKPALKVYSPQQGGVLFDLYPGDAGPGKLTIDNGTGHHAICKLIDISTNTKICSFLVLANTKKNLSGLPDGTFRILFAYGDLILEGTDRFQSPSGFSKFAAPFEYTTTRSPTGYEYSSYTITLHKVVGGNTKTSKINQADYDKY